MPEVQHKASVAERAARVAEPLVQAEGFELVDVEYLKDPGGWILRLYIDRAGRDPLAKEGGVGLEECVRVSHAVETALDVDEVVEQNYSLEVSSPGVNRPLRKPEHYRRVIGKRIKVKTFGPVGTPGRKSFTGTLEDVADDGVTVHVEGGPAFRIPFRDIAKANLEFDF
jgi:ribosome maturation factor RimP